MKKEYIIGTFNLKNDMWNKNWNYKEYADSLSNYILENKVDFLGTQELTKKYSYELDKSLDKYNIYGKYRFKRIPFLGKFDERVGIITKYKPYKIYNKYLSLFPGIPRVMSAFENEHLLFINVHLDYKSKLARKMGLNKIYKFILKHKNKNIVLLGDFNIHEDDCDFKLFVEKLLKLNIKMINNDTGTFSKRHIDYIFLSNNIELKDIWTDKELKLISDHRPIFIKIKL